MIWLPCIAYAQCLHCWVWSLVWRLPVVNLFKDKFDTQSPAAIVHLSGQGQTPAERAQTSLPRRLVCLSSPRSHVAPVISSATCSTIPRSTMLPRLWFW